MRSVRDILEEKRGEKKDKDPVFKETDPMHEAPFPNDTISALKREINKGAKDLEKDWSDAIEVVNYAFDTLDVPRPLAHQKQRWEQYNDLIAAAVRNLYDARGFKGDWKKTQ